MLVLGINAAQSLLSLLSFLLQHLLHALHAHTPRHGTSLLHLLHHAFNPLHSTNSSQHLWIHSFSHTLVHLKGVEFHWWDYYLAALGMRGCEAILNKFIKLQTLPIFWGLRFLTCFSSLKSSFTPPICFTTPLNFLNWSSRACTCKVQVSLFWQWKLGTGIRINPRNDNLHLHDTSSTGNSGDSCWLFGEGLESIHVVKFLVMFI